jgi:hypothetical protein
MIVLMILAGAIPVSGLLVLASGAFGGGITSLLYYPRPFDSGWLGSRAIDPS